MLRKGARKRKKGGAKERSSSMPVIKANNLSTFSSEDTNHPASNLLSSDTYRKWKCASGGEKQAVVVFELQTPVQIHSVDIGNEGSAFVEILVARTSAGDDYKVLLVASSFMSPTDSKSWKNTNRVRMFGPEKLSKGVVEEKWDRIKIVCTQPYNKKEQYGLSFVTLHSPPGESSSPLPPPPSSSLSEEQGSKTIPTAPSKLGAFSLKEEPKALPSGSLFYKKEVNTASGEGDGGSGGGDLSTAAQARIATSVALKGGTTLASPSAGGVRGKKKKNERENGAGKEKGKQKEGEKYNKKKTAEDTKKTKVAEVKDTEGIMKGVAFSLSGFKNPLRGELREKLVQMGASFHPDWSSSCTHLVCAFSNTPKFNQVKGGCGLIVKKQWVLDSYTMKKRLPASKYRLSSGGGEEESSEEEEDEAAYDRRERELFGRSLATQGAVAEKRAVVGSKRRREEVKTSAGDREEEEEEAAVVVEENMDEGKGGGEEDIYGGSTDDEEMDTDIVKRKPPASRPSSSSTECDTEDEIQRIKGEKGDGGYGDTTETDNSDEGEEGSRHSLADLPDLFSQNHFMLHGFSGPDLRLVRRYIIAYNGFVEDYMSGTVSYVVTPRGWDSEFDKALEENSSLVFVRPQWIFRCHEKRSLVPHQPFVVVPS